MSTTAAWSDGTISDLSGAEYFAGLAYGDNGDVNGTPTVIAGTYGVASDWDYPTWDSNVTDGLDSGWVDVSFAINTGGSGGVSFDTSSSSALSLSGGTSMTISQVTIQAAVASSGMQMSWRELVVYFYNDGQIVDTVAVGTVCADTLNANDYSPLESVVVVTTASTNYDGVYITGQARLVAAEGVYPGPIDIFGQVAIN